QGSRADFGPVDFRHRMLVRCIKVFEVLRESSRLTGHFEARGFVGNCYRGVFCMGGQLIPESDGVIETSECDVRAAMAGSLKRESNFVVAIIGVISAAKLDRDS